MVAACEWLSNVSNFYLHNSFSMLNHCLFVTHEIWMKWNTTSNVHKKLLSPLKHVIHFSFNVLFIKVHFDDVSLYGTPKEEPLPSIPVTAEKTSSNFLKNQLQAWFQPTDNRLAMKLFGSKKALVKERIRQKTAGHWVIHPCSSFRWVKTHIKMNK